MKKMLLVLAFIVLFIPSAFAAGDYTVVTITPLDTDTGIVFKSLTTGLEYLRYIDDDNPKANEYLATALTAISTGYSVKVGFTEAGGKLYINRLNLYNQ